MQPWPEGLKKRLSDLEERVSFLESEIERLVTKGEDALKHEFDQMAEDSSASSEDPKPVE